MYTADLYEGEPTREEAWLESDIRDAEQDYADRQASAATESTGNDYMSQEYYIHLAEDYSLPPQSEPALDPRLVEARTQYGLVCWSQRGNS